MLTDREPWAPAPPQETPLAGRILSVMVVLTAAAPYSISFAMSLVALFYVLLSGRLSFPHWSTVLFVTWCAASISWSDLPTQSVKYVLFIAFSALALWCLVEQLSSVQVYEALASAVKVLLTVSIALFAAFPAYGREVTGDHVGALKGVFATRNAAALTFAVALTVLVFMAAVPAFRFRTRSAIWALIAVAGLVATESSTGITVAVLSSAALLVVLRIHRWRAGTRWFAAFLLLVATVVLSLAGLRNMSVVSELLGRDDTLTGRTRIWEAVEPYLEARPWLGYGWGALWREESLITRAMWGVAGFRFPNAHNAYMEAIIQVGVIGLVLLLLVILGVLVTAGFRVIKRGDIWSAWPLILPFLFLVHGVTESSFVSFSGWQLLVIASALLHASRPVPAASTVVRRLHAGTAPSRGEAGVSEPALHAPSAVASST